MQVTKAQKNLKSYKSKGVRGVAAKADDVGIRRNLRKAGMTPPVSAGAPFITSRASTNRHRQPAPGEVAAAVSPLCPAPMTQRRFPCEPRSRRLAGPAWRSRRRPRSRPRHGAHRAPAPRRCACFRQVAAPLPGRRAALLGTGPSMCRVDARSRNALRQPRLDIGPVIALDQTARRFVAGQPPLARTAGGSDMRRGSGVLVRPRVRPSTPPPWP